MKVYHGSSTGVVNIWKELRVMKNVFFSDEVITKEDVFYVCSLLNVLHVVWNSRTGMSWIVWETALTEKLPWQMLCTAKTSRLSLNVWLMNSGCRKVIMMWQMSIPALVDHIPTEQDMGKVYMRLVLSTLYSWEDYADAILRVYNDKICRTIDNYNGSAYYEPSYYLTRCYYSGTFN